MTDTETQVLTVLAGQSAGYYAYPDASAFVAVGLVDANTVETVLDGFVTAGNAEREQITVIVQTAQQVYDAMTADEQAALAGAMPDPVTDTVPGGYAITDAGRSLLAT